VSVGDFCRRAVVHLLYPFAILSRGVERNLVGHEFEKLARHL
jgi:hypothetical protein